MNKSTLKNGKYYTGKLSDPGEYRGWFCGSFFNPQHPGHSDSLEIKYTEEQAGKIEPPHYHEQMIEVLIILGGKAKYKINNEEVVLSSGDFLFVDTNNIISGQFLEYTKLLAIHTPSLPKDEIKI